MGFLSMIGLVTAKEHARLINQARDEEAQTIRSLNSQLTDARRGFFDQQSKFKKAAADLADSASKIEALEGNLKAANDDIEEWKGAALRNSEIIDARNKEIAALTPDAEAMRAKRQRDRDQKAGVRERKAIQAATKDAISDGALKIGKATGKPRIVIPAKVGKTATAVISGDRPAKKGARK